MYFNDLEEIMAIIVAVAILGGLQVAQNGDLANWFVPERGGGSIGGAIEMNSGCYGYDISQVFTSLKAINFQGELKSFNKDQIEFFYRGNSFNEKLIFLSATFQGKPGIKNLIQKKQMKSKYSNH